MIIRQNFSPRASRVGQGNRRIGLGLALFIGFEGVCEGLYPAADTVIPEPVQAVSDARKVHMSLDHFLTLGATHFRRINPSIVVSPLMGKRADAMDVAQKLQALGYTGPYHAFAPRVANAGMIAHEVRTASPGIRFDLTQIPQTRRRA